MMSKQRRTVLSEEEFSSTLSSIVQRDYFPDLPNLEKQAAVLNCRQVQDFKGAVAVRRAARRLEDHEHVSALKEEEEETNLDNNNLRRRRRPLHRETISGFHARATSEDNHEFEQNLQTELRSKRSRIEEVYQNPHQICEKKIENETPLLASDQFNAPSYNIKACTNPKLDNGFFFAPKFQKNDLESKILETKLLKYSNDSKYMPPPKTIIKNDLLVSKSSLIEYIPKSSLEKYVEPSRTRFPKVNAIAVENRSSYRDETSASEYSTDATTDLDSEALPIDQERRQGFKRKQRELETLVDMTPLIEPRGDASPITTWGEISHTPVAVGVNKSISTTPFHLPAESAREKAAREVEEKLAGKRARMTSISRKSRRSSETPLMNGIANLTPAARALLQKRTPSKNYSSVRSSSAFSNSLLKSYTPAPMKKKSSMRDGPAQSTPKRSRERRKSFESQPSQHLTDGLLNLPK